MTTKISRNRKRLLAFATLLTSVSMAALVGAFGVHAQNGSSYFYPGNLVVSRSVYVDTNTITARTTILPPDCSLANCPTPVTAVVGSSYPYVFNNDGIDVSFGITSKILLDQIMPDGTLVTSLEVPNSSQNGVPSTKDQMVTSFSSKSEVALNLSTDGKFLTYLRYYVDDQRKRRPSRRPEPIGGDHRFLERRGPHCSNRRELYDTEDCWLRRGAARRVMDAGNWPRGTLDLQPPQEAGDYRPPLFLIASNSDPRIEMPLIMVSARLSALLVRHWR